MLRLISHFFTYTCLFFVTFFNQAALASELSAFQKKDTIRVAVANEIPYGYIDFKGNARGIGPDVLSAILPRLGINHIEWTATNFSALIPGLKANRFDVVAAEMAILPERCKNIIYSEPNSSYGENLLVPAGNPNNIHSYQDIIDQGLTVAIMAGADQLDILQAMKMDDSNIITLASNSDAISTVSTQRADAYAATILTVAGLAEKNPRVERVKDFKDPVINGKEVRSYGAFTLAKHNTALRDALNDALAEFKQSKEWRDILLSYGLTDHDLTAANSQTTKQLCE